MLSARALRATFRRIDSITCTWAILVAATIFSFCVGTGARAATTATGYATITVLALAFIKVWLVGIDFMELRNAPWPLKYLYTAWCIIVCTTLVVISTV